MKFVSGRIIRRIVASPRFVAWLGIVVGAMTGLDFKHALAQSNPDYWTTVTVAGTLWDTGVNWSTGATPGGAYDAVFNAAGINGATTAQLGSAQSALGLYFNNTGTTLIDSSSATTETLSLGTDGLTVASSAGAVTLGNATNGMALSLTGSQTWSNNTSTALTVTNGVGLANAGTQTLTLGGSGSGGGLFSGVIANGAGALALNVTAGTWKLAAANTFSGGATIGSGANLELGNGSSQSASGFGTGTVTVNAGGVATVGNISGQSNVYDIANSFVLNGGTINVYDGNEHLATGAGAAINVTAASTIATSYYDKPLNIDEALTGSGNLTFTHNTSSIGNTYNATNIFLNSGNTAYTGAVTISNNGLTSGQSAYTNLFLNAAGALQNSVITINDSLSRLYFAQSATILTQTIAGLASPSAATGVTLALQQQNSPTSETIVAPAGTAMTLTIAGSTNNTFYGAITGSGNLTIATTGSQTLAGANTYTGPTSVTAGTLFVDGTNGSAGSPVGAFTIAATSGTGTLGGTGTIYLGTNSVSIGAGGALMPGYGSNGSTVAPLTLSTTGSVTLTPTSTFEATLANATGVTGWTPGSPDTVLKADYLIAANATVNLDGVGGAGAGATLALGGLNGLSLSGGSLSFLLIDPTTTNGQFGSITGVPAGMTATVSYGQGVSGADVVVTISSVPEPGTRALACLAALALAGVLFRRRHASRASALSQLK